MKVALARLEALESDNAGVEVVDLNDDEYGSTDEEDHGQFPVSLSLICFDGSHFLFLLSFKEIASINTMCR